MKFLREKDPAREILHLETGKLFRDFIKNSTYTHKLSRQIYDDGGLQPEFLTVKLWSNFFVESMKEDVHLVIDGTPRKFHEAQVLDSAMKFYNREKPYLLYLNVSRDWATERLKGRGRVDDNRSDIKARLDWFETDVVKAIGFYKHNPDYHFVDVNGEREIEEVHIAIQEKIFNV